MFYRIIDNKLADYALYKYNKDCMETDIITVSELDQDPDKVIVEDGVLILNPDWEEVCRDRQKKARIEKIKSELAELDSKRIRAICENEIKDEETGQTWLDYYNEQVQKLRQQLN